MTRLIALLDTIGRLLLAAIDVMSSRQRKESIERDKAEAKDISNNPGAYFAAKYGGMHSDATKAKATPSPATDSK